MKPNSRPFAAYALVLTVCVVLPYLQTRGFDFVAYDDNGYVSGNMHVRGGLCWSGLKWALSTGLMATWHPLTWLSLMADITCFGRSPGAMHIMNVLLHASGAVLLFAALVRLTANLPVSWLAAAWWALHPLRVESVAWICQRKDVLSTCFGLLALLCYLIMLEHLRKNTPCDQRRQDVSNNGHHAFARLFIWQGLATIFFLLGFMSKPAVITFPCLAAVIEFLWLGSIRWKHLEGMVWIAVVGALITVYTQQMGDAVVGIHTLPILARIQIALAAIGVYAQQTLIPRGLAVHYPLEPPAWHHLLIGVLFCAAALFSCRRVVALTQAQRNTFGRLPLPTNFFGFVALGLGWFLVGLAPMSGLVQIGCQGHADRFASWPSIGLAMALACCLAHYEKEWQSWLRIGARVMLAGWIFWLAVLTYHQVGYWRDTETLMKRAMQVVPEQDFVPYSNLGIFLCLNDRFIEGSACLRHAMDSAQDEKQTALYAWSLVLAGDLDQAKNLAMKALDENEQDATPWRVLGMLAAQRNDTVHATRFFCLSLVREPSNVITWYEYGNLFAKQGRWPEALAAWQHSDELEWMDRQSERNMIKYRAQLSKVQAIDYRTLLKE